MSFGETLTFTMSFPVGGGEEGRACQEDRFYETWAEYDDWYFYPDPDIEGQWCCMYLGRYTATSTKFYERVFYLETRPAT